MRLINITRTSNEDLECIKYAALYFAIFAGKATQCRRQLCGVEKYYQRKAGRIKVVLITVINAKKQKKLKIKFQISKINRKTDVKFNVRF